MAIASAATAAVSVGMGAAKFFKGRKMEKAGERFIENFEWQDLQNPFENQQVSTMGRDFMQEQSNIGGATAVNALREGGQRALVGGLGRVEASRNDMNRQVANNLDTQQQAINTDIARQTTVNQGIIEKRQGDELAGYGQMMNVGMGLQNQGMTDVVNGLSSATASLKGMPAPQPQQYAEVSAASTLSPAGTTFSNQPQAGGLGAGNSAFGKQYFVGK
jgi:hypothetical protein